MSQQLVAQADPQNGHTLVYGQEHSISLLLEKGGLELLRRVLASAQDQGIIARQIWDRLAFVDPDGKGRNPVLGQGTIQDQNTGWTML